MLKAQINTRFEVDDVGSDAQRREGGAPAKEWRMGGVGRINVVQPTRERVGLSRLPAAPWETAAIRAVIKAAACLCSKRSFQTGDLALLTRSTSLSRRAPGGGGLRHLPTRIACGANLARFTLAGVSLLTAVWRPLTLAFTAAVPPVLVARRRLPRQRLMFAVAHTTL